MSKEIKWSLCHNTRSPEIALGELEKFLGMSLPLFLAEIMRKYNSGVPSQKTIKTPHGKFEITSILSLEAERVNSVQAIIEEYSDIPPLLVPFAPEENDGFMTLLYRDKADRNPRVSLWHPDSNELIPVAETIEDFFARLR
jgi:hypothetical protein